ncbi:ATP-binding protein [Massilia sp. AB1]|uniref:hybrid sensor histidine kinase/response regulator n=1 Tax=Massilia sp. AB1 TaxID=2823371 RepID=UPI001B83AE42|nr:ATP-binding protein [Massilia sp. AB1]MBQ5942616.1 PAS domain S-box protein [Massilia sp. AB1]
MQNHQSASEPDPRLDFAAGGGAMGALLRARDWSATPLGPLEQWPQPLRTAVGIMLGSIQPMYIAWGAGLHLLFNDGYRDILGARAADPEQVLGQPFAEVWHEVWDTVGPLLEGVLQGRPSHGEDRLFVLRRNGYAEEMYASFSATPLRDEAGAVAGVFCVCAETTSKMVSLQERDAALVTAEANALFRTFFEQGTHYAALMSLDGRVLEVNQVALDACGYRREDVLGRPFWECGWWNGSAALMDTVRASVASAAQGATVRHELPYFIADGSRRWTDVVFTPVTGSRGELLSVAATGADITERRQVEERLRLLDAIGEATRIAAEPKAIMQEATRLLGEHLGVTRVAYADLEADNDRFTIRHDWTVPGAISTAGVYSLDLFGSRARDNLRVGRTLLIGDVDTELASGDGYEMFNQIGIKAIICCPLVKGGKLVAMMAVHQDTPRAWTAGEIALVEAVVERCWAHIERVRSTEALRDADRRKSEFLATLAHELRNPLAPVRNGLEILRMSASPAVSLRVREMMERQVNHMVHLINDLLDIARVSSGKLVLQKSLVDLREVIGTAVETSQPLIDGAGHTLDLELPGAPMPIEADAVRISQVLSNLLSNAAKYTPAGGHIAITARVLDGVAEVEVADNGIGIAPESLGAVFEMFSQVARSIDRSAGGLGIGLSLVRRLVELHGGSVTAVSAGPGQGSLFTVRLPLAGQAADAGHRTELPQAAGAGRRLRVLVADDNADAADSLCSLLQIAGHETRTAYDGVNALEVAAGFHPELVFLDIGMPRMDGYEAARRMRELPGMRDVLLAALTGWGAAEDRARSREAGFDHHLLKPAQPAEVQAVLAEAAAA